MPAYESELLTLAHAVSHSRGRPRNSQPTTAADHRLDKAQYSIVYKPGKQNIVADAIGRRQESIGVLQDQPRVAVPPIQQPGEWDKRCGECVELQRPYASTEQRGPQTNNKVAVLYKSREFTLGGQLLQVRTKAGWKLCVRTGDLRRTLLKQFHDHFLAGHRGIDRTRVAVRDKFTWRHADEDTTQSCVACARGKNSYTRSGELLQPLPTPVAPREDIPMDLIVRLPRAPEKHDAILAVVCRFTKMAHFLLTTQLATAADHTGLLLGEVVRLRGVPKRIVRDRDPRLTSEIWQQLCQALKTQRRMSTAY